MLEIKKEQKEQRTSSKILKFLFGWLFKDNPDAPPVTPPSPGRPENWPVFKE